MGICFLEKKCPRISENYFLPSLRAKLLITVWDETPCTWNSFKNPILLHQDFLNITMCSKSFTSDILHFRERERKGQKRPKAFSYLSVLVSNICKLQDFILVNFLLSIKKKIDVWYDDNKCNYGDAWWSKLAGRPYSTLRQGPTSVRLIVEGCLYKNRPLNNCTYISEVMRRHFKGLFNNFITESSATRFPQIRSVWPR